MPRKIERIIKAAADMTKGKYHVRIPVRGHDELSRLGEILNQLGNIIEKSSGRSIRFPGSPPRSTRALFWKRS